ncbi:CHAT domain-containing protein [Streptomyces globosus]|uniref:CHAT domain-containing protein n=1 Tax=Streptomyces globosus TaxID=68209 RepID=UPI00363E0675
MTKGRWGMWRRRRGSVRERIDRAVGEFARTGRPGPLDDPRLRDDAEELLEAAAGAPPGAPVRAEAALHLGRLLLARTGTLDRRAELPALAATVAMVGLLHDAAPESVEPRLWELTVECGADPMSRARAANRLLESARQAGEDDLPGLVTLHHALADFPEDHPDCGPARLVAAVGWLERYERTGADRDLDGALTWGRAALRQAPAAGPGRELFLRVLAAALTRECARRNTGAAAAEAVEVCRKLLAVRPQGSGPDPERIDALAQLGGALHARYGHTRRPEDLDEAIAMLVAATAPGTEAHTASRAPALKSLASALYKRHQATGDPADLDALIALMEEAVRPGGLEDRAEAARWGSRLVGLRLRRARLPAAAARPGPRAAALPDAVERAEEAVRLIRQAEESGPDADPLVRDVGIELLGPALEELPEDHPDRGPLAAQLGTALLARHRTGTGDPADLEAANRYGRVAARLARTADPRNRAGLLLARAQAAEARYEHSPDPGELDAAIALYRELTGLEPPPVGELRWHCLHNLGKNLLWRCRARTGTDAGAAAADLDEGVDAMRRALALVRPPSEEYLLNALNLALALVHRQGRTDSARDLREARSCLTGLLACLPDGDERAESARALLATVDARIGERDRVREEGLRGVWQGARVIPPRSSPEVPPEEAGRRPAGSGAVVPYLHRLGAALARYDRTGDPDVLEQALDEGLRLMEGMPEGHPSRPEAGGRVGALLLRRFEREGRPDDLDTAIGHLRSAAYGPGTNLRQLRAVLGMPGAGPAELRRAGGDAAAALLQAEPERGPELSALAAACVRRFERDGARADLDEAVAAAQRAVEAGGEGDRAAHCARLATLGTTLALRHRAVGDAADLERSIGLGREVVEVAGRMSAAAAARVLHSALPNLSNRLRERYLLHGSPADLDEAVELGRRALALHADPDPQRQPGRQRTPGASAGAAGGAPTAGGRPDPSGTARTNLALALWDRARLHGGADDLDAAIAHAAAAADALPSESPRTAQARAALAGMLADRSALRAAGDSDAAERDAVRALEAYADAARCPTSPPQARLDAALAGGRFAADRAAAGLAGWERAATGYAEAVALLPVAAWRGLERGDRERLLAPRSHAATDAAACALACGRPEQAVELLDQGRAVLWGQALDSRTGPAELARAHPEAAGRLVALRAALEQDPVPLAPFGRAAEDGDRRRRAAAREWDALVADIRTRPGFGYFMLPMPFAELSQAAAGGPLVLVNVSRLRCDALVVTPGRVRVVPLPALDAQDAQARTERYLAALERLGRPGASAGPVQQTVLDTLEWLWDAVAAPVLDAPEARAWRGRRLWWCATGPLALLPVHAAGYHDPDDDRPDDAVVERVVSSYIPTLRALGRARAAGTAGGGAHRLLAAAVSERPSYAPGLEPLPGVRAEAEALRGRFPGRHTVLRDAGATRARVLELLPSHGCVHFACHGGQDLADPGRGALYLHDGPLTVGDLARLDLPAAELAVLSACQTALGGVELPNEAIHLAGALLLGNFRQVVSTLWTVGDGTARRVADELYGSLAAVGADGEPAASPDLSRTPYALHAAVARIRAEDPYRPLAWASYVHFGP